MPHRPGHGSLHLFWIHAWFCGHCELDMHSGLQFGADPIYDGKQEQAATPLFTLHSEFGPHGDGLQGSVTTSGRWAKIV